MTDDEHLSLENLLALSLDELADEEADEVRQHLLSCPDWLGAGAPLLELPEEAPAGTRPIPEPERGCRLGAPAGGNRHAGGGFPFRRERGRSARSSAPAGGLVPGGCLPGGRYRPRLLARPRGRPAPAEAITVASFSQVLPARFFRSSARRPRHRRSFVRAQAARSPGRWADSAAALELRSRSRFSAPAENRRGSRAKQTDSAKLESRCRPPGGSGRLAPAWCAGRARPPSWRNTG